MEFRINDTSVGGLNFYHEHKRLSNASKASFSTQAADMNAAKLRRISTFPKNNIIINNNNNHSCPAFSHRCGRRYLEDGIYPLPYDHEELNRQTVRHLLYGELLGGYHVAEFPDPDDIPHNVLDVGCGNGIWSACVSDSFSARGRKDVQFTGIDIVDVHPSNLPNFSFVQHDILQLPLPFVNNSFDYIFCREISMCMPNTFKHDQVIEEFMRILRPGGTLEIQCSDHAIRCLLPSNTSSMSASTGAYSITSSTQFNQRSPNSYVQEWNKHIGEVLMRNNLSAIPCTLIHPLLLMETKSLTQIQHRRFAIPFHENWEETTGVMPNFINPPPSQARPPTPPLSIQSKDEDCVSFETATIPTTPPSPVESTETSSSSVTITSKPSLTEDGKALRILTRRNFVDMIKSLEPILRDVNHISQDEWDQWYYGMLANFIQEGGLSNGECLEFGAWWGKKLKSDSEP